MAAAEEDRHLRLTGEFDCDATPLATLRHSTSHVMAQAVKRLFPEVKVAIGPAIDDGFYYDFAKAEPFTPEDLARIEDVMREIVKANVPFERQELARADAVAFFEKLGERFKVEILHGIEAPTVSLYKQGDFIDLCRGPHVRATGEIKAFKLLSSSGAYWRGDEKNPMLQRIYGTAWLSQEDLDKYLWRLEEAKKRDHRKLGRELDLFDFYDVAPGAPFWLPNGMILVRELEKFARERLDAQGYRHSAYTASQELTADEVRLLGSYVRGPRIWDAAALLPTVTRLTNLGLITPVSATGAAMRRLSFTRLPARAVPPPRACRRHRAG